VYFSRFGGVAAGAVQEAGGGLTLPGCSI